MFADDGGSLTSERKVVGTSIGELEKWSRSALVKRRSPGDFQADITGLTPGKIYRFRAIVVHPKITMRGEFQQIGSARSGT